MDKNKNQHYYDIQIETVEVFKTSKMKSGNQTFDTQKSPTTS